VVSTEPLVLSNADRLGDVSYSAAARHLSAAIKFLQIGGLSVEPFGENDRRGGANVNGPEWFRDNARELFDRWSHGYEVVLAAWGSEGDRTKREEDCRIMAVGVLVDHIAKHGGLGELQKRIKQLS